jgi:hypothetical protein
MVRENEIAPTIGITCAATVLNILRVQAPTMWSFVIKKRAFAPFYFFAFGSATGAGIKAQASLARVR